MANRPAFCIKNDKVTYKTFEFTWFPGLSVSQKQKSIESLHSVINKPVIEISSKSMNPLGRKLSAFFLKLNGYTLENVFQSGKVFESGGPYRNLLHVSPKEAKQYYGLRNSGSLIAFEDLEGHRWDILPRTAFYDYIYIEAVRQSFTTSELLQICEYDYFTDIEFNPQKSINCQARTVALVKLLLKTFGEIPKFEKNDFVEYHKAHICA